MSLKPINPYNDDRVEHKTANLNGHQYHYILGVPKNGQYRGTIFLIHGWPDLSMGWRYQIPLFLKLGLRVVAPDLMGFGRTDAPQVPPELLKAYSVKTCADDMAELAKQLGASKIILGGHDWGGFTVWRIYQHHPSLVTHIFSICTGYTPPHRTFLPLPRLISLQPNFSYQSYLASPSLEHRIQTKDDMRHFLHAMYGGWVEGEGGAFDPKRGVLEERLGRVGRSRLLEREEGVGEFYVEEYWRRGVHGGLNWYRTREVNHEDDQALIGKERIEVPALYIGATKDSILSPDLTKGMERFVPNLSRAEVEAGHWALIQKPDEVNAHLEKWFKDVVFPTMSSKL